MPSSAESLTSPTLLVLYALNTRISFLFHFLPFKFILVLLYLFFLFVFIICVRGSFLCWLVS